MRSIPQGQIATVTADARDAARYRWLRRSASWPWVRDNLWQPIDCNEFDSAIDAAIAAPIAQTADARQYIHVGTVDPPNPSVLWNGDWLKGVERKVGPDGKIPIIKLYTAIAAPIAGGATP